MWELKPDAFSELVFSVVAMALLLRKTGFKWGRDGLVCAYRTDKICLVPQRSNLWSGFIIDLVKELFQALIRYTTKSQMSHSHFQLSKTITIANIYIHTHTYKYILQMYVCVCMYVSVYMYESKIIIRFQSSHLSEKLTDIYFRLIHTYIYIYTKHIYIYISV